MSPLDFKRRMHALFTLPLRADGSRALDRVAVEPAPAPSQAANGHRDAHGFNRAGWNVVRRQERRNRFARARGGES